MKKYYIFMMFFTFAFEWPIEAKSQPETLKMFLTKDSRIHFKIKNKSNEKKVCYLRIFLETRNPEGNVINRVIPYFPVIGPRNTYQKTISIKKYLQANEEIVGILKEPPIKCRKYSKEYKVDLQNRYGIRTSVAETGSGWKQQGKPVYNDEISIGKTSSKEGVVKVMINNLSDKVMDCTFSFRLQMSYKNTSRIKISASIDRKSKRQIEKGLNTYLFDFSEISRISENVKGIKNARVRIIDCNNAHKIISASSAKNPLSKKIYSPNIDEKTDEDNEPNTSAKDGVSVLSTTAHRDKIEIHLQNRNRNTSICRATIRFKAKLKGSSVVMRKTKKQQWKIRSGRSTQFILRSDIAPDGDIVFFGEPTVEVLCR
jgi:hypothetical protein